MSLEYEPASEALHISLRGSHHSGLVQLREEGEQLRVELLGLERSSLLFFITLKPVLLFSCLLLSSLALSDTKVYEP